MSIPAVTFIVCHAGPAGHFSAFTESLLQKGYKVQIYASGPALNQFKDCHVVSSFSNFEERTAIELAERCKNSDVVITDVGHPFAIAMQKACASRAPNVLRLAYYDNPEEYVPGGYSRTAEQVMKAAHRVLFANANLASAVPSEALPLDPKKKIGIGFYPITQVEEIARRRAVEQVKIRGEFFSRYGGLDDRGQKIFVYAGGNNDEYFSEAFPAFLHLLAAASKKRDLSNTIMVLQQHPGAKERNIDGMLAQKWIDQMEKEGAKAPRFVFSHLNSADAQVVADAMLYYQTSMAPGFVLAGIPTIQVGHKPFRDILVKQDLCFVATNTDGLLNSLIRSQEPKESESGQSVRKGLGIETAWADRLERAISARIPVINQRKISTHTALLGACSALVVAYLAIRAWKRISAKV